MFFLRICISNWTNSAPIYHNIRWHRFIRLRPHRWLGEKQWIQLVLNDVPNTIGSLKSFHPSSAKITMINIIWNPFLSAQCSTTAALQSIRHNQKQSRPHWKLWTFPTSFPSFAVSQCTCRLSDGGVENFHLSNKQRNLCMTQFDPIMFMFY